MTEVRLPTGAGTKLFVTTSKSVLRPTHHTPPPIQRVPEMFPLAQSARSPWTCPLTSSSADVKNVWSYTSTPPIRLHGMLLIKHRDNFAILPHIYTKVSQVVSSPGVLQLQFYIHTSPVVPRSNISPISYSLFNNHTQVQNTNCSTFFCISL
jgi:hypothetical protein